jgi:NAD(P)-dependent dehydrogenase (short-subunit alcohol dehydrogenase family)
MPERPLEGKVAIVTGGGGGIGRAHALALARYGASVLVNDYGPNLDGSGNDPTRSEAVAREIRDAGGEAIGDHGDVGSWADAEAMVAQAVDRFGGVDILINNAGILRPKTLVGMTEADVAPVLHVHLMGTFAMTHHVAVHWRQRFKEGGFGGGRLINTTSASGLYGFAQANYAAAKAGIAALTAIAALELSAYGATANAISPVALTRMSTGIAPETHVPEHAAELASWLATDAAASINGHVFNVGGGHISIADRWHTGASADKSGLWTLADLGTLVPGLAARSAPFPDTLGYYPDEPRSPLLPKLEVPSGRSPGSQGEKR